MRAAASSSMEGTFRKPPPRWRLRPARGRMPSSCGCRRRMPQLAALLDALETFHGPQIPSWPTDPYLFLVWWHCGYPASDVSCAKGWETLQSGIGVDPDRLLAANPSKLALALKPGGMVPELRAMRLKEIAERVQKEFAGGLRTALQGLSLAQVRAALKKFPNIGDPAPTGFCSLAASRRWRRSHRTALMFWYASKPGKSARTTR